MIGVPKEGAAKEECHSTYSYTCARTHMCVCIHTYMHVEQPLRHKRNIKLDTIYLKLLDLIVCAVEVEIWGSNSNCIKYCVFCASMDFPCVYEEGSVSQLFCIASHVLVFIIVRMNQFLYILSTWHQHCPCKKLGYFDVFE